MQDPDQFTHYQNQWESLTDEEQAEWLDNHAPATTTTND